MSNLEQDSREVIAEVMAEVIAKALDEAERRDHSAKGRPSR